MELRRSPNSNNVTNLLRQTPTFFLLTKLPASSTSSASPRRTWRKLQSALECCELSDRLSFDDARVMAGVDGSTACWETFTRSRLLRLLAANGSSSNTMAIEQSISNLDVSPCKTDKIVSLARTRQIAIGVLPYLSVISLKIWTESIVVPLACTRAYSRGLPDSIICCKFCMIYNIEPRRPDYFHTNEPFVLPPDRGGGRGYVKCVVLWAVSSSLTRPQ